jgi:hypothetical protein
VSLNEKKSRGHLEQEGSMAKFLLLPNMITKHPNFQLLKTKLKFSSADRSKSCFSEDKTVFFYS